MSSSMSPLNPPSMPNITEAQILESYLLPPSPLPTIIPFSSFLSLVPATYRNSTEYNAGLKRLYRDLQFQRSLTLEQVRENIERECGVKAATLRARLAQRIAIEEGDVSARDEDRRKRRRTVEATARVAESGEGEGDDTTMMIKDEESIYSSEDEFSNPLNLAAQETMYKHPSNLHPAAHVLPVEQKLAREQAKLSDTSAFYTRESLLVAMDDASQSLSREIDELEAQCLKIREGIGETVGGLSDLRYGKRQSEIGRGAEEFQDVVEALEQFRGILKGRIAD